LDTALAVKRKLREAPQNVLRYFCLWAALALAKPAPKATRLFQFAGFFYWKAGKSPNKQALSLRPPADSFIPVLFLRAITAYPTGDGAAAAPPAAAIVPSTRPAGRRCPSIAALPPSPLLR
jgi:hypothetical protein